MRRRECHIETGKSEQLAVHWVAAHRTLAAFVGTLLPHPDDIEDVLQRVAVTAVRKFDAYDASRPFVAWAIGIAKFEVKSFQRQRITGIVQSWDDDLLDQITSSYLRLSDRPGPLLDALDDCLRKLDDRSRRLVELRYAGGATTDRMASQLGASAGSARTALCRIRGALRDCVERQMRRAAPRTS